MFFTTLFIAYTAAAAPCGDSTKLFDLKPGTQIALTKVISLPESYYSNFTMLSFIDGKATDLSGAGALKTWTNRSVDLHFYNPFAKAWAPGLNIRPFSCSVASVGKQAFYGAVGATAAVIKFNEGGGCPLTYMELRRSEFDPRSPRHLDLASFRHNLGAQFTVTPVCK